MMPILVLRRLTRHSVPCLGLLLLTITTAKAQHPVTPNAAAVVDPAPLASFADPLATRNIPGHVSFVRYDTPGQCLAAVIYAQRERMRDPGLDTLFGPASIVDRFPPDVRDIGMRCRAQLPAVPAASVAPRELQNSFELATLIYDTVGSDAALAQWLAAPQTLADQSETSLATRAKRIDTAIKSYMYGTLAGPQRIPYAARAHALLARLEAMGPAVRNQRLAMQEHILSTESQWAEQETGTMGDPRQMLKAWLAWLAGVDSAGGIRGPIAFGANGFAPAYALLSARVLLDPKGVETFTDSVVKAFPKLGAITAYLAQKSTQFTTNVGHPVPSFRAPFWYGATGDTVWPVPGHFSLLFEGDTTLRDAAFLRRVAVRYGSHGLRMLLVKNTAGYWDRGGTETGPRTAAQEAVQDSAYYLGYLKLPTMLAVRETKFQQLPNGWWEQIAPVQYERHWELGHLALVDPTGKLLFELNLSEAETYTFLDRYLGVQTSIPSSHPLKPPVPK